MRTSQTHPLRIADTGHGVGITFCPGKRDPYAMSGGWDRDLVTDLDAIVAWGAHVLVTLVEPIELEILSVPRLPEEARARLEWHHLPIEDGRAPDAAWEARWREVAPGLHAHLDAGRRVVVHCRGGLGRAGLVAARLLIERGLAVEDAIELVRRVRPGAIETAEQEVYLGGLRG